MLLRLTPTWLQLEVETSEEWQTLEGLAASRTCGPTTDDVLLRLRVLAADIAPGFRHAWEGPAA